MSTLTDGLGTSFDTLSGIINNLTPSQITLGTITAGALAGGVVVGSVMAAGQTPSKKRKSKKKRKKITHTSRGWAQDRKRRSKQKWEVAYQKKKKKKKKRNISRTGRYHRHSKIKYTKKGQPYIILSSGKARFIKKRHKGGHR